MSHPGLSVQGLSVNDRVKVSKRERDKGKRERDKGKRERERERKNVLEKECICISMFLCFSHSPVFL